MIIGSYQEQLASKEWKERRKEILDRDWDKCTCCKRTPSVYQPEMELFVTLDATAAPTTEKAQTVSVDSVDNFLKSNDLDGKCIAWDFKGMDHSILLFRDGKILHTSFLDEQHLLPEEKELRNNYRVITLLDAEGNYVYKLYKDPSELEHFSLRHIVATKDSLVRLNVHHKRYIIGKNAWEYSNDDLVTLCQNCHLETHKNTRIKVYTESANGLVEMNYTPCQRCSGAGWFPEYKHVQNGVCFRCHGARYEELIPKESHYQTLTLEDVII